MRTDRLLLRPWTEADCEPFAAMNADPEVMRHFPKTLSREESDLVVSRICTHFDTHGFGLWALEVPGVAPFAGFVGLAVVPFQAHFTPAVEIGWRLAAPYWGQGYATEAARAALQYGFEQLGLDEMVSYTAVENERSQRVMERIGMSRDLTGDFDHPNVPDGHRLKRHVLYRISRIVERSEQQAS
jgi:RimJ/RimL family protein N-acetyltransferase